MRTRGAASAQCRYHAQRTSTNRARARLNTRPSARGARAAAGGASRAASRARNAAGLGDIACRSLVLDYAATGAAVGGTVERAQAGACTKEG